ncbi:MAG: sulfurtransferase TusA [Motiliproteus sp.]
MTEIKPDHCMDASGLYCPEPVMMLHNKVRDIAIGEVLEVIATDPSTERDIPKFCAFLGHELIGMREHADCFYYLIRKGEG